MHNHLGPKLLLLVAALFLVVGAASVQDASAASATKTCIKQDCKAPKKSCVTGFKGEYKTAKTGCKSAKKGSLADCKAIKQGALADCTDSECRKQANAAFKECKGGVKAVFKECMTAAKQEKAEGTTACNNGFKNCKACCKAGAGLTDCIIGICGDGVIVPGEECDTTNEGCQGSSTCIPAGDPDACTCAEPCGIDPVPTKLKFTTELPEGICGCTLKSPDDTSCAGTSKIGDLACGDLLVGGGLSAVPPGPTPDGATTFVELTACRGTELLIGPSAGDGQKTCSFGTDDGGGPCFYGPALPVINNTDAMSTCVLNTLLKNISGTTDPTTGSATLENVDLNSRVYLTGDLIKNRCRGGTNPGAPCVFNDTTCDGICAVQRTAACDGGTNDGQACVYSICVDGLLKGNVCTDSSGCLGGTCKGICTDDEQVFCADDSECTTGTCSVSGCPGGTCRQTGSTVEACPVCVDADFNPITKEGEVGTCDLGINKGQACESSNSTGLTIDCPPADDTFLADINVTIPTITTETAELRADEDGNFCNFGECFGGEKDAQDCDNDHDCPGGTCDKKCQVLGGPDPDDPNGDPFCVTHDDCVEPGQTTWRPCGQSEIGAFIRSAGDEDTPVGGPEVRRVILTGTRAPAPVLIGETKPSKLVAAFCIPRTGEQEVDNAGSLPGPGATSLAGTVTLLAE